jgi:serine/threonine protein kinase
MRFVEGRDLEQVLADGPLEPQRAVRMIEEVAKALHAAHKVGLVHRDIKPSNILLDEDDFAYLIDFGIARAADDTRLTETGLAPGTLRYMAPERLRENPDEEDARVDIYALACVFYECLTGRPPFGGTSHASLIAAHLNTPPPRPSTTQPNLPTQFDEVIATGMAKDPERRYQAALGLAAAAKAAITQPMSVGGAGTVPAEARNRAGGVSDSQAREIPADAIKKFQEHPAAEVKRRPERAAAELRERREKARGKLASPIAGPPKTSPVSARTSNRTGARFETVFIAVLAFVLVGTLIFVGIMLFGDQQTATPPPATTTTPATPTPATSGVSRK